MSIRIGDMYYQLCEEKGEVGHDLPYKPARRRKPEEVDRIVIHWTGGRADRPIDKFVGILGRSKVRGLGYHFVIDLEGTIWQLADPATEVSSHAGGKLGGRSINQRSVGVAFMGAGHDRKLWPTAPLAARERGVIHKKVVEYQKPSSSQLRALCALLETLTEQMGIARNVNTDVTTRMTPAQFDMVGIVGHYQVSTKKFDPGPWVLEQVEAFFSGLALGYEEGAV